VTRHPTSDPIPPAAPTQPRQRGTLMGETVEAQTGTAEGTDRDREAAATERLFLLVAGDGVYATQTLPTSGSAMIGRASDSDLRIEDPSISRNHAMLHLGPPLAIEDLGSANGTFVHERRLDPGEKAPIQLNEAIRIGSVTVIVQRRSAPVRPRRVRSHDYFESRVDEECARAARNGEHFAVVHLVLERDLSTDAHGILLAVLREADVIASYSPGEIEILMLDTDPLQAEQLVRRLGDAMAARGMAPVRVGSAWYPRDGRDPNTLAAIARDRAHGHTEREVEPQVLIVADERMRAVHDLVARVASADISVLLLGETGAGKEVIAEMVHRMSARRSKPLVRLNCAALTETLLESELFGHERGSFTGATHAKPGLLEVANGGVVFLDEIGELPMAMQVKLLRVLDERKVLRVGGLKPRPIDVRLVSATNRDLDLEVRRGTFRLDLLYRLNAMSIVIPPLRERTAEIEPLARNFIRTIAAASNRPAPRLADDALALLMTYSWPGNVRELRNVIERAVILCSGAEIHAHDLPEEKMRSPYTTATGRQMDTGERRIADAAAAAAAAAAGTPGGGVPLPSLPSLPPTEPRARRPSSPPARPTMPTLPIPITGLPRAAPDDDDADERARILAALDRCAGNQTQAAALLGISRRTLINRLEKYAMPRPRKRRDE
jgi:two-component system response regulator AtoC